MRPRIRDALAVQTGLLIDELSEDFLHFDGLLILDALILSHISFFEALIHTIEVLILLR